MEDVNNLIAILGCIVLLKPYWETLITGEEFTLKGILKEIPTIAIGLLILCFSIYKNYKDGQKDTLYQSNMDSLKAIIKDQGKYLQLIAENKNTPTRLRDTITKFLESNKETKVPLITHDLEYTRHKQTNDTLYIYPSIRNDGNSPALNVSYRVYFNFVDYNNKIHRFNKTVLSRHNHNIPENKNQLVVSDDGYVPNVNIDSVKIANILLIGEYWTNAGVRKSFTLGYVWPQNEKKWLIGNADLMLKIHHKKIGIKK
jgi:hypothetical protein